MVRHIVVFVLILAGIGAYGQTPMTGDITGIGHAGSTTINHGNLRSVDLACLEIYADGFSKLVSCTVDPPSNYPPS